MAMREILLPWDSQPQEAVGVDWENPDTADLICAFGAAPSAGVMYDATGRFNAPTTQGAIAVDQFGLVFDGASGRFGVSTATYAATQRRAISVAVWVKSSASDTAQNSIIQFGRYVNNAFREHFALHTNIVSAGDVYLAFNGLDRRSSSGGLLPVGVWSHIAVSVDTIASGVTLTTPGAVRLWVNGASVSLSTEGGGDGPLNLAQGQPVGYARDDYISGRNFRGRIGPMAAWSRGISEAEALRHRAAPWRLFAPRITYIPTASGVLLSTTGDSTATLTLTGDAAATLAIAGQSTGTFELTGTATAQLGDVAIQAASDGVFTLSGTADATVATTGTSVGVLTLTGTATALIGFDGRVGESDGLFTLSGTATAAVAIAAESTGVLELTGSATASLGSLPVRAESAGVFEISGSAAAQIIVTGVSVGEFVISVGPDEATAPLVRAAMTASRALAAASSPRRPANLSTARRPARH